MKWMRPNLIGTDFVLIGLIVLHLGDYCVNSQPATVSVPDSTPIDPFSINSTSQSVVIKPDNLTLAGNQQTDELVLPSDVKDWSLEVNGGDQRPNNNGRPADSASDVWSKIRHLHQKVRLKETADSSQQKLKVDAHENDSREQDYVDDSAKSSSASSNDELVPPGQIPNIMKTNPIFGSNATTLKGRSRQMKGNLTSPAKPFRILASGLRKNKLLAVANASPPANMVASHSQTRTSEDSTNAERDPDSLTRSPDDPPQHIVPHLFAGSETPTGVPNLENRFSSNSDTNESRMKLLDTGADSSATVPDSSDSLELYDTSNPGEPDSADTNSLDDPSTYDQNNKPNLDIVTKFLRIVESQSLMGENCTAGTDFNLGEGVVDRYAQERFRLEAEVAVNRANWLTRMWKSGDKAVLHSEYLLHVNLYSIIEMDEDIFAAGNCYDKYQYKDYVLFCPYAFRMPEGPILAKDLAVEYKYLTNTSEWFYIARKNAERVIRNMTSLTKAYHTYTANETAHTDRYDDEILSVSYEDGKWSKPYFDCGGGNIWMMTYTVPFFGFANGSYFFKGTSGIDIDLRRVDIDQCPPRAGNTQLNIFAASDKCKPRTTKCEHIPGLGFRRGSYRCECKDGFYYPDKTSPVHYYNGTVIEEEYEKKLMGLNSDYDLDGKFECLRCPEGCDVCVDDSPCIVTLNWVMRTTILILEIIVICCLPVVALFTWRYSHVKVVRAASPALLRLIILGAFFIYCTILVAYTRPNMITCSLRIWFREIGFSFAYGALMLKTWRISVIFRVRSAKAVKITDLDLIKRLGIIVSIFAVFLTIRTIVGPPHVIVAKTADDLKAYICETDWWDHVFTAMEMMVLVWGIRLCIVVRKAPSEFNESRFISMAIYNEFLLSIFLNVSMLFLQSPANPDLMYIIMFSHTQLTTTLLLVLIFASKAYLALRGRGKGDDSSTTKPQAAKFLSKPKAANNSNVTPSVGSFRADMIPELSTVNDPDIQAEIRRLLTELEQLKDKTARCGHTQFAARLSAMSQAARQVISPVAATEVIDPSTIVSASNKDDNDRFENGPSTDHRRKEANVESTLKKRVHSVKERNKSPKHSPDSGLGGLMFHSGPVVNNVLACVTDRIVCATFSADPTSVAEDDEENEDGESASSTSSTASVRHMKSDGANASSADQAASPTVLAPVSSLALAAAPLLTSNFAFDTRGVTVLRNYSAPNSRRSSEQQELLTTSVNAQLSLVGDHTNSGALLYLADSSSRTISVQSLCHLPAEPIACHPVLANHSRDRRRSDVSANLRQRHQDGHRNPLSPKVKPKRSGFDSTVFAENPVQVELPIYSSQYEVDSSVRSGQITPDTPGRSLASSRSRINTEDRERFTEEVTV